MNQNMQPFRIDKLELRNFRAFSEFTITFHKELTVLVAPNGGGKTAILDAVGAAWNLFVDTLNSKPVSRGFDHSDISLFRTKDGTMEPVLPTSFDAEGVVEGNPVSWSRALESDLPNAKTKYRNASELKDSATRLRERVQLLALGDVQEPPNLPIICYYGTGRLWGPHKLTKSKLAHNNKNMSRLSGYADCLSSTSRYKFFVDWFERLSREVQQEQVTGKPSPHRPGAALDAVRIAVDRLLEPCGWSSIEWDFAADEIVANHQAHGRLPVSILSDGIRNIVGLVADLALRTSRLNPHFGRESARLTSGIVLIDEVDMHLHPVWQQLVLPAFRGAFPAVQFIVTTHSPQVLSTTKAESIRIIRSDGHKGVAFKPLEQTEGVESSYLMALVLGADPVPPIEIVRLLSEYRSIIQQGLSDSIGAQVLKEKLEAHFGSSHPIILDSQRLIRLEKFKRENLPLPSQQPHADK